MPSKELIFSAITLIVSLQISGILSSTKEDLKGKKHPSCKGLWRSEKLVGRCFGLSVSNTYSEFRDIVVESSEQCRRMCCNMEDKCVSWQYQAKTKECKLGGIIRLGTEAANTHEWCEPLPPAKWNGKRLLSRDAEGKCTWGAEVPTQCFGLGPERKSNAGLSLSASECEAACCAFSENGKRCTMWQEIPGRGCYFNAADGIFCEEYKGTFDGGRKCVPGVCGGKESEILVPYLARMRKEGSGQQDT